MEILGSEGELSSGYKLVPWSSWEQWNFVRESLFSSSPDLISNALHKISAWRSRGCLPVPVDVTAAIAEIQQKDPYFRAGSVSDAANSNELLAMLYCMAIMRLVNCFVEPAHKKTRRSISELADAVGIPRMLVDIRHESSHRDLPSLRLVRMASVKALDWLKSNYWEPQRRMIPDVRKEIRSRLRQMSSYLKIKHGQSSSQGNVKRFKRSGVLMGCNKLSSQIVGKLQASKSDASDKKISKITKIIARLYSSYPSEVVAVLLEFFHFQAPDFSDDVEMECSDDLNVDDPEPHVDATCYLKAIITKLSRKKPGLILGVLKTVLEMIEAKESAHSEKGGCHFNISHLSSLVYWLLMNLKSLKDSGRIGVIDESPILSTDKNASPNVSLTKLLHKILPLSVIGDENLSSSIFLLAHMNGDSSLTTRLKKFPLLAKQYEDFTKIENAESMSFHEEAFLKKASENLELIKLRLSRKNKISTNERKWNVAKSWTPCPIGMLPCSFSLTAVPSVLDKVVEKLEVEEVEMDKIVSIADCDENLNENGSERKRLRAARDDQELDLPEISSPTKGRLLIGGIWKQVSEEELVDIELRVGNFAEIVSNQS